jgi:hypothetical protein
MTVGAPSWAKIADEKSGPKLLYTNQMASDKETSNIQAG